MKKVFLCLIVAFLVGTASFFSWAQTVNGTLLLGIDVLQKQSFRSIQGRRVAVLANEASVNSRGERTVDVLVRALGSQLVAIYVAPRDLDDLIFSGRPDARGVDARTNVPVFSLGQSTSLPFAEIMKGVDVIVIDWQDIGHRGSTFLRTLEEVMRGAAGRRIGVVVLDRPNPLGGERLEGPTPEALLIKEKRAYSLPLVHGLTIGELAMWMNHTQLGKRCRLTVVPMSGWRRWMEWEDTGLNWIKTSPNLPHIRSVRGFAALGLLHVLGVSVGAAERRPFEIMVGPNIDANVMAMRWNRLGLAGIFAEPWSFEARREPFAGMTLSGAWLQIQPKTRTHLAALSYFGLDILRANAALPAPLQTVNAEIGRHWDAYEGQAGSRVAWQQGLGASDIMALWSDALARWQQERVSYLLYK